MSKVYDYIHAEGVIREKATMIDPGDNWPRGDDAVWEHDKVIDMKARKREYDQHIASLKTYPVYPSLRELWGADREVTIDVDFYLACVNDDCDCRFARHCKGPYTAYPEAPYNAADSFIVSPTQNDLSDGELPCDRLLDAMERGEKKEPENRRFLVRDLHRKTYAVLKHVDDKINRYEILHEFYEKPFPDLKCQDCGIVAQDVKYREWGSGIQCYKCHKDDKEFEDDYK